MKRKIQIAIPTYTGEIGAPTVTSLLRAVEEARALGAETKVDIRAHDSFLTRGRNLLVQRFLDSDATDLVFWDADVATAPGGFARLISHDVEAVAGCYRARSDPERYMFNPLANGEDLATGLLEVEGVGAGFFRLTRAAIERMVEAFPDAYVVDDGHGRMPWLFDFEIRDRRPWSEDFVFCRRLRAAGGRVWVDPDIPMHHTGPKTFSGLYADFWRAELARRETPESLAAAEAAIARLSDSISYL